MLPPLAAISRGICGQSPKSQAPKQRATELAANFKAAVESNKVSIEREHTDRQRRAELVESSVCELEALEQERIREEFAARERQSVLAKFRQWSTAEFDAVAVLGQGSFGTVYLVRQKETEQYFALKQMTKLRHAKKNLKRSVYTERDVLSHRNRWFVELWATFQDAKNIFMLMEFLPGGDLFKWIETKSRFSVAETRFYMAELLEALDALHSQGFIHRDVKFDNMVLTRDGHLKLLDFGLCRADPSTDIFDTKAPTKSMVSKRREAATQVGTVYYMAPEVMRGEVSPASDVWAVGVMTYECLYGSPPFHANEEQDELKRRHIMRQMVLNHKKTFPPRLEKAKKFGFIPPDAERLMNGIMCEPTLRLTIAACRVEPFFKGLDFSRLHEMEPPIKPELDGPADIRNFDEFPFKELPRAEVGCAQQDPTMEWTNYDFDQETSELRRPEALRSLIAEVQGS